jgi:hypothetical protein
MSDLLAQASSLEEELVTLSQAETLDDQRIAGLLERRDALHRQLGAAVDENPELLTDYRPFFQQAYKNTQALQQRCQAERSDIQEKLITLNQSKKARKAY